MADGWNIRPNKEDRKHEKIVARLMKQHGYAAHEITTTSKIRFALRVAASTADKGKEAP